MTDDLVADDQELLLDTSKMTQGQREALELAESARETKVTVPSFCKQLFLGDVDRSMIWPFPEQDPEDRAIGDALVAKVDAFLRENIDGEEVDETRTIPDKVVEWFKSAGLFGMKIPKKYGGLGLSQTNYNRVIMMVASHCSSSSVLLSAHQSIGVPQPLKMFGTEEQKRKFLPMIAAGAISAFALTEPEVGSDPARLSTTAEPSADGSYYTINGDKLWCTNGPIADVIVVMAATPPKIEKGKEKKQITAFIVECKTAGIETIHRCDFMGIRGIQNGLICFKDVKVPKENIIWGEGRGLALALRTLNIGRLTLPAACSGLGKVCLNVVRRWGKERIQWGLPVGEHEAGAKKVVDIASSVLAMEAINRLTSYWVDQGDVDIRMDAALAKLFCSELASIVVDQTLQLRGGRVYEKATSLRARGEEAFPVERLLRDCRINTIIEGTSEIMHLFIAREMLDPHLSRAKDLLRRQATKEEKIACVKKLLLHYAKWYPKQWLGPFRGSQWKAHGKLGSHLRYVERQSAHLSRTIVHKMASYQQGLERHQLLLGHLVDIGKELFAIAATCSYAVHLNKSQDIELADYFSRQARLRIADHYRNLSTKGSDELTKLTKNILSGETSWLEEGVFCLEE